MIKVGILGTGFGEIHAKIYNQLEGVEIAGVFGRTQEKLDRLKEELNVYVTMDADELIHDPDIDLIDVCLPTSVHKEYVIKALKQKKHVFCETPVSYTLEEAEEMRQWAKESGKELLVDLFFKFSDPHRLAIERMKSRDLGTPQVVSTYQKTSPHWGDMNFDKLTQDFMIHNFDFIAEILGMPTEVVANGLESVNSHAVATLKYEEGLASVETSTLLPGGFPFSIGFDVICESGTISFTGEFSEDTVQKMTVYQNGKAEEVSLPDRDDYEEALKHVVAHIGDPQSASCLSIDQAIKSLKLALAVKESLREQSAVHLK